ncbi:MAG: type II secretion system F family protein [Hyphomicrobiaceae bacterium]
MMDIVQFIVRPEFLATFFASVAAFATVLTLTLPLLTRDRMSQRMKVMAVERDKMRAARLAEMSAKDGKGGKLRQAPKGFMQKVVDQLDLRARFDNEEARNKLKMAGMRGQAHLVAYMFFRVALPPIAFLVALFYLFVVAKLTYPPAVKVLIAIGIGVFGYYLPNVFLENKIQKRQLSIRQAFPDSLDMLLICVQSGMSVEAAFAKVAKEAASQSIELAEELSLTTAELSYLQDRRVAYDNLGKRTGIPGVKAVATALIQAERYGTPVGTALRVMAKENRDMRMSEAEKKAAALPPKLTVPMIIFFLPVLFIVIMGPAVIQTVGLE